MSVKQAIASIGGMSFVQDSLSLLAKLGLKTTKAGAQDRFFDSLKYTAWGIC
jgi:hypothetical protein